jgi:hypothetical protein
MRKQDIASSVIFSALTAFVLSTLPLHSQIQVGAGGGGGGGTPGGSNTQLQYNNSAAFGGTVGFTWDNVNQAATLATIANPAASAMTLTGGALTGASSFPVLNMTQTWNNATTLFTGIKLNVTNTNSAASSLLMDLQVGGTSQFNVDKTGVLTLANSVLSANNIRGGGNIETTSTSSEIRIVGRSQFLSPANGTWQLRDDSGNNSVYISFPTATATPTFLFGQLDAAAPVAQTLAFQNVVAGTTNTAGANATIQGSRGTGTGAGGDIIFQAARAGTTGTSQNTFQTVFTVKNTGVIQDNVVFSAAGTPLPTCNGAAEGSRAAVSDALTPTFLTAYVSGGAVHASVYCDGTSWKTD